MLLLLQADWTLLQAGWPQVRRRRQPWWTFPPQVVLHSLSWRKASGGMVSRVLMCPHIVPPALVGCTLDGRHSVLDKGFQLLWIFLYPGQHNLGVNPVIGVGFREAIVNVKRFLDHGCSFRILVLASGGALLWPGMEMRQCQKSTSSSCNCGVGWCLDLWPGICACPSLFCPEQFPGTFCECLR